MEDIMKECTFELNKYTSEQFLNEWEIANKTKGIVEISDVEIEFDQETSEALIQKFFLQINDIDNEVQKFCKENYERSTYNIKNYIVDLAWIKIKNNTITLGYWGEYVNIELRAICKFENLIWKIVDIYYQ
jgi:glycosylphosphatidylinositol transamidase (GPIT) subunit GPI8